MFFVLGTCTTHLNSWREGWVVASRKRVFMAVSSHLWHENANVRHARKAAHIMNHSTTEMSKKRFLGLEPWVIWLIAGLFTLFQFMLQTSTSVMIPSFMHSFHIDALQVGLLSSSFLYAYVLLQVPGGILIDRFGARLILMISGVGAGFACFLFAFTQHLHMAEAGRMLIGAFCAPSFAATLYLASNWFPVTRFALLVGLTEMIAIIGGIAGEANLAVWVEHFGWRETLVGLGIVALILAALAFFMIRDRPAVGEMLVRADEPLASESLFGRLYAVMSIPQVWVNGLFAACLFTMVTAFAGLWMVPFIQILFQSSLVKAAFASSMIFVGVAVGSPIIGWLANKRARRRTLMFYSTLLSLLLLIIIIYIPWIPMWLMWVLLFAFGFTSCVYLIPFSIVRDITPPNTRGTAMGFTNFLCIILGAPILQPLIGYLLELNKSGRITDGSFSVADYRIAFSVLPIILIAALGIIPFVKK